MIRFFVIGMIALFSMNVYSADIPKVRKNRLKKIFSFNKEKDKHSKLTAAAFDITLGFLGVHRLYLGTSPKIPVVYAITLGGGGFLVWRILALSFFQRTLKNILITIIFLCGI